jgi:hypothetical protein
MGPRTAYVDVGRGCAATHLRIADFMSLMPVYLITYRQSGGLNGIE